MNCVTADSSRYRPVSKEMRGIIMKELSILPHVGIWELKLGMSPKEILEKINRLCAEFHLPEMNEFQISKDDEVDGKYYLRYQSDFFFFLVQYDDKEQAVEIGIDRLISEQAVVRLYDLDVFKTPAEELILYLKKVSSCSYDDMDEQLSTNYEFNDIGIRLWREHPFHEKLLKDPAYIEEMRDTLHEMFRYRYFDIAAVQSVKK